MSPKISILYPSFRHEKSVGYFITSVLSHVFLDFELLIVDDYMNAPILTSLKLRDWLFFRQPTIIFVKWGKVKECFKDDVRYIFDSITSYVLLQKQILIMVLSLPKKKAIS